MIHPFGMVSSVAETNYCTLKTVLYICQIQNNDTPVQSQLEWPRAAASNEGGFERSSEGPAARETVFANRRLIVSR